MLYIYPSIIHQEDGYWIEFPDLVGCNSQGDSLEELIVNAQEALEGYILDLLEDGEVVPKATDISKIKPNSDSIPYLISIDIDLSKRTKSVKKTLTIPSWLNEKCEEKGVNFSKTLQEALIDKYFK